MVITGMTLCNLFLSELFQQLPVALHHTSAEMSFLVAEDVA